MKFSWPVRVYYEDTDAGGVVYHSNYLKFFERARTEFLRELGVEQNELIEQQDVIFAVRQMTVDFNKPAVFNDLLTVETEVMELKKASFIFRQTISRSTEETILCQASCKVACLKASEMKPRAVPDEVAQKLTSHQHC